jgi:hypothetical protein
MGANLTKCEHQIKQLTHEIDRVVYEIFGISGDKQKIIERDYLSIFNGHQNSPP